jgi:hypothetical protein
MIAVILITGAIGVIVYALVATLGLFVLPRFARHEIRASVRRVVVIMLGVALVLAALWAPYVSTQRNVSASDALARYCPGAEESIYRTVDNVEGLFILPPPVAGASAFHSSDTDHLSFMRPPKRLYKFMEIGSWRPGSKVRRYDYVPQNPASSVRDQPEAQYALTWRPLLDWRDTNLGVFGEETLVYDRTSNEILARRVLYYHVERSRTFAGTDTYHLCPKADVGVDEGYIDKRPHDSYQFVAKVLRPPALSARENIAHYDLAIGTGRAGKSCALGITLGPGIARSDVRLSRERDNLVITRSGSADVLECYSYFFQEDSYPKRPDAIHLADGTVIPHSELHKLRDTAPTMKELFGEH